MRMTRFGVMLVSGAVLTGCGSEAATSDPDAIDYEMETVALSDDWVIDSSDVVRVGPGVDFELGAEVRIVVHGRLIVEATEEAPSSFVGGGEHSSWHGIVVEAGGELVFDHVALSAAKYGVHALAGSDFSLDHTSIEASYKSLVLESDGTVQNSEFSAVALAPAVTTEVSLDDPNGNITILDASPEFTNCRLNGGGPFNDMVRVGGEASPVFDQIYVHSAHCGFHTSGGTNTGPRITNTVMEGLSYGIMAYTARPVIEDSVFLDNTVDVGLCVGATEDSAPALRNNFYSDGDLLLDASCAGIGTEDASPAAAASATAGAQDA